MKKGVYNFIIAVCIVLIVIVVLLMGSYFWYQFGTVHVSAKQPNITVHQQPAPAEQTTQTTAPLSLTTPLKVTLNGHVYPIDVIRARSDGISISTKEVLGKFPDLKIDIRLSNHKITNFSDQALYFTGKSFSDPTLQVSWMEPGNNLPKNEFIMKNYELQMQFGQERDYRIPVQLKLNTHEKITLSAVGKFTARTSDLVVINGKVDVSQDNSDTLLYVIGQFIKQADGVQSLKSLQARSHSMSMPGKEEKPDPNPSRVYSSATIYVDFESTHGKEAAEFQMVRPTTGWQVYQVLKPERLKAAVTPDLSLDTLFAFDYLGQLAVDKAVGKDKVETWERKGSQLMHRNPDPKKDQTQTGSASYLVKLKDGSQRYVKLSAIKDGVWRIEQIFNGAQIPEAHARKPAADKRGSDMQKYLAAVRLEKSLNNKYPNLQVRGANFSCGYSLLLTDCRVTWRRLVKGKGECEGTTYMFKRSDKNAAWKFVRELAVDEQLDHRNGQVKKRDKPRKYSCW